MTPFLVQRAPKESTRFFVRDAQSRANERFRRATRSARNIQYRSVSNAEDMVRLEMTDSTSHKVGGVKRAHLRRAMATVEYVSFVGRFPRDHVR